MNLSETHLFNGTSLGHYLDVTRREMWYVRDDFVCLSVSETDHTCCSKSVGRGNWHTLMCSSVTATTRRGNPLSMCSCSVLSLSLSLSLS